VLLRHLYHAVQPILAVIALLAIAAGCGGNQSGLNTPTTDEPVSVLTLGAEADTHGVAPDRSGVGLKAVLDDIETAPVPEGIDPTLYDQFKLALSRAVSAQAVNGRVLSGAPAGEENCVTDLRLIDDGESQFLKWTYINVGDYDLNSEVNISDLTPVGLYIGATPQQENWDSAQVADGDGNEEVNISDITPIGQHYLAKVDGYFIEWSDTAEDGSWQQLGDAPFTGSASPAGSQRWFTFELPEPVIGRYYRVTPYQGEDTGVPGSAWQYTGTSTQAFMVSGTCRTNDDTPVSDVELTLSGFAPVLSQADGSFTIHGVEDGYSGTLTPYITERYFYPHARELEVSGADVTDQDFAVTKLPEYRVYISQELLDELYADVWISDYKSADVNISGSIHEDVGVRFRGATARTFPKQSWKISFNDTDEYPDPDWDYKRGSINLNAQYADATLLREKLSYDLMQDLDMLAPRARFVRLYINDEYYGMYTDVENPRRGWLDEFGYDNNGSMYQAQHTMLYELPSPEDYEEEIEKQLLEDEPFDDLAEFIGELNNWSSEEIYNELSDWMDTEQLKKCMVGWCLIGMADNINTNYYLYHDIEDTGKWLLFPWDMDRTWGHLYDQEEGFFHHIITYDVPLDYGSFSCSWCSEDWGNVLYDRYFNEPQFWQEYTQDLSAALDTIFDETAMLARVDEYYELVLDSVLEDTQKWGENADYETRIDELKSYITLRHAFIEQELAQ